MRMKTIKQHDGGLAVTINLEPYEIDGMDIPALESRGIKPVGSIVEKIEHLVYVVRSIARQAERRKLSQSDDNPGSGHVTPAGPHHTTNRLDPGVVSLTDTRGDLQPTPQHDKYLILSDGERAKGYIRPVRRSYVHVGAPDAIYPIRRLTPDEVSRWGSGWAAFEPYPTCDPAHPGKLWTQEQLDNVEKGCRYVTTMSDPIAETYARDPKFYGATYCVHCQKHLPVAEFVWEGTNERVGS